MTTPASIASTRPAEIVFPDFGIFAIESYHSKDFHAETFQHDYVKVLFVIDGKGELMVEQRAHTLEPLTPVFVPAGQIHHLKDDPRNPLSLFALCVKTDALPPSVAEVVNTLTLSVMHAEQNAQVWHERFRSLLYEQTMTNKGRAIVIFEHTLWILQQITSARETRTSPGSSTKDRMASSIKTLNHDFYRQQSLKEAARTTGLSERRFSQLFRDATGTSWLNYLLTLRITHARYLLEHTDRSVTSIAFECGFSDLSNFYKAFKKQQGGRPLEFREAASLQRLKAECLEH
jgi:AraC-like DNA-binding protein